MHPSQSENTSDASPKAPRSLTRLLVFVAVASVSLVAGLYGWPSPVKGYRAETALDLFGDGSEPANPGEARRHLSAFHEAALSPDNLAGALRQVGPPPHVPRKSSADFPAASEIDFVKQRLTIEPAQSKNSGGTRIAVRFTAPNADWSVAVLDAVARQALAALEHPPAAERPAALNDAEAKLAAAKEREQTTRRALDTFLAQHFEALNRRHDFGDADPLLARAPAPPKPTINPQWQAVSDQLAALTAQYERLVQGRTLDHPQVQETGFKIEATRQELQRMPQYLDGDVRTPPVQEAERNAKHPVGPAQFTQTEPVGRAPAAGKTYEHLLADLQQAKAARQTAQVQLETAAQAARKAAAAAPVVRGRIVATAHVAQTLWEAPSTNRLTVLALASIFVGACVATIIRVPRTTTVLTTTDEVEAKLSLPVVGVVPSPSRSAPLSR
jgi:hypothetical protein